MKEKHFTLTYPWDENGYRPEVDYVLSADESGFCMHMTVYERDPRRTETEHQKDIYKDSCAEWFVNFAPEICDRYFNFEVNANGAMYAAFRKNRYEYAFLPAGDMEKLEIQAEIRDDRWEVRYRVPFSLIRKYIPDYRFEEGMKIRTNFYKCGDETAYPHFGIWNESPLKKPDFHRPEYFAEVILD